MDLVADQPQLNMYSKNWPVRTHQPNLPPPSLAFRNEGNERNSIVCPGSVVSGARLCGSILGPNVRVAEGADVQGSILFEGVQIGAGAKVRNAIIEKGVEVPAGAEVGCDPAQDRERGFQISEKGVTVVAQMI